MEDKIRLSAIATLDLTQEENGMPLHDGVSCVLNVSENVDKSQFFTAGNLLTKLGAEALTVVLTEGLIANIHFAHSQGLCDSAEHLRRIIAQLEQGFITQGEISLKK